MAINSDFTRFNMDMKEASYGVIIKGRKPPESLLLSLKVMIV
jgi:hypothetical protein